MTKRIQPNGPIAGVWLVRLTLVLCLVSLLGCAGPKAGNDAPLDEPERRPRYDFTHLYLRQLFFLEPETLMFAIQSDGVKFLRDVWVTDVAGDSAEAKSIDCKAIGSDPNQAMLVIAPPQPLQPTDAYLIALLLKDGRPRYFTFEKILDVRKTGIQAVLCEWTESEHKNHTLATARSTLETFLAMIDRVTSEKEPGPKP